MEIEVAGGDGIKIDCPSAIAKLAPTIKQAKAAIFMRKFSLPRMFLQRAVSIGKNCFLVCSSKDRDADLAVDEIQNRREASNVVLIK